MLLAVNSRSCTSSRTAELMLLSRRRMASRFATHRARPRRARVPAASSITCSTGREDVRSPRALHPVFLRQLRLALVRARLLAARAPARAPCPAQSPRRHADSRAVRAPAHAPRTSPARSRTSTQPMRGRLRAALRVGVAADARGRAATAATTHSRAGPRRSRRSPTRVRPIASASSSRRRRIRSASGTHFNTAFALALALEYADTARGDARWRSRAPRDARSRGTRTTATARRGSRAATTSSRRRSSRPSACARVLPAAEFAPWLDRFLPRLARRQPATLFEPATVSDRSDGKIAHLDGLNLSRAWCWRSIAAAHPAPTDARRADRDSTPRDAISRRACRTSPATTWASTGSRRSRSWPSDRAFGRSDRLITSSLSDTPSSVASSRSGDARTDRTRRA